MALTDVLLSRLKKDLQPQGFNENSIRRDPRDRNAILVIVPGKLMNFQLQKADLQEGGKEFLRTHIASLAEVLCSPEFRSSVDSIVVEGHTDRTRYGKTEEESQNNNLKLSQDRSMAVVKESLADLSGPGYEQQRACFLEKLSATGWGEQDPEKTDEDSRRVIFKIRVKSRDGEQIIKRAM